MRHASSRWLTTFSLLTVFALGCVHTLEELAAPAWKPGEEPTVSVKQDRVNCRTQFVTLTRGQLPANLCVSSRPFQHDVYSLGIGKTRAPGEPLTDGPDHVAIALIDDQATVGKTKRMGDVDITLQCTPENRTDGGAAVEVARHCVVREGDREVLRTMFQF